MRSTVLVLMLRAIVSVGVTGSDAVNHDPFVDRKLLIAVAVAVAVAVVAACLPCTPFPCPSAVTLPTVEGFSFASLPAVLFTLLNMCVVCVDAFFGVRLCAWWQRASLICVRKQGACHKAACSVVDSVLSVFWAKNYFEIPCETYSGCMTLQQKPDTEAEGR